MMGFYGLKPLDNDSVKLLTEFYQKLIAQRKHCYFCQGGNTCRCGQCPEIEYHDTDCLVSLIDRMLHTYRHGEEDRTSRNLLLTTVEEVQWYRERIATLEEKLGIDFD